MFCSEESNRTFRLQNNTTYERQSIQFGTTFKQEHGSKVNYFCKMSFKDS